MKLSRLGEFGLIDRVRRTAVANRGVRLGIGDDAAWVRVGSDSCLLTSDLLIEGIHFHLKWTSLYDLGYKTLAVNVSDIAAMGGKPAYLLLSLGIPSTLDSDDVEEFYHGIRPLASEHSVALVGGDISIAKSLFISVCLIGLAQCPPVTRAGARVGDDIYVTGTLGDSALALKLLKNKSQKLSSLGAKFLLARHHRPTARVRAGTTLAKEKLARAMIDISDGLLKDLGHICKASRVGATVMEEALPLSQPYRSLVGKEGTRHALSGGEDYELLFCARQGDRSRIADIQKYIDVPLTRIGTCVHRRAGITVLDRNGQRLLYREPGYDHFKHR
jgi:thiamine-monophosphate kinase